jgi:3-deoxy-manno-octulosonate cytidylyltransferase (CMP-KDO synthetase)
MKTFGRYSVTGIIPARYASTRFPGKPLAAIGGKTMIQRVYEQASKALDNVYVATDDRRISDAVKGFCGRVVMTSPEHQSGTDRCAEAAVRISAERGKEIDIVVNIQGDEPFIRPDLIGLLVSCFSDRSVEIATLIRKVEPGEDLTNPSHPKVILDVAGNAIYFSRAVIPFIRDAEMDKWTSLHQYYKHIGLYAYRSSALSKITALPKSLLEKAEALEQNRWLENGFRIRTVLTEWESVCIDTPEDLEKAKQFLSDFE